MKITLLTNEYPPYVYGGAGVHIEHLSRELRRSDDGKHDIEILCFGDQEKIAANKRVKGILLPFPLPREARHPKLLDTLFRDVLMADWVKETDIVHCHTWYTHLAGCLTKELFGAPLVLTSHSLEPDRPWKEEQLGAAYRVSTWLEKTAYQNSDGVIAVSRSMGARIHDLYGVPLEKIRVIPNGIDIDPYRPTRNPEVLAAYGIDPEKPFILFVGRITRQKGILHLVRAVKHLSPGIQVVLCAGAPDTEEIRREMVERVEEARAQTANEILWIHQWVPTKDLATLYSHASVFVCPSVYEPFGIINLEAMACETPVVASAVGGIPEVVTHGETGWLVSFEPMAADNPEPKDPEKFSRDLAEAVNRLLQSSEKRREMGVKARERVVKEFTWKSVAEKTLDFYRELLRDSRSRRRTSYDLP